jgi:hypothetical protein
MTVEQVINLVKTAQSGLKREKRPLGDCRTDLPVKLQKEALLQAFLFWPLISPY